MEDDNRVAWGEEVTLEYTERTNFLYSPQVDDSISQRKQGKIITYSGLEWLCRQVLKEVADRAVELSGYMAGVELWEEWEEEVLDQPSSSRSVKEERRLWRALDECDREEAKEVARVAKKVVKKVNQARSRMGAGKNQPGIADMFAIKANSCKVITKKKDSTISSNRPSNVVPRMLGQSNRSLSNVPVMGGCCGQAEHPPMTGTHEGEDETDGGNWRRQEGEAHSMVVQDEVNSLGVHEGVHDQSVQDGAHSMGVCQGAPSPNKGGGLEEAISFPAWSTRSGWKSS